MSESTTEASPARHSVRNCGSGGRGQTWLLWKRLALPAGTPIVTGDYVETAKPSPDIFATAADRPKVAIHNSIAVGDSVWGLLAVVPRSALGVGFLSGGYGQPERERARAFRVYSDAADLLMYIEQLGLPEKSTAFSRRLPLP